MTISRKTEKLIEEFEDAVHFASVCVEYVTKERALGFQKEADDAREKLIKHLSTLEKTTLEKRRKK